jgi:hypothetical protein
VPAEKKWIADVPLETPTEMMDDEKAFEFLQDNTYEQWVIQQPVASGYYRRYGVWEEKDLMVKYFDDCLRNGEYRRLILCASGKNCFAINLWKRFVSHARNMSIDDIEFFTTNSKLDHIFLNLGAWLIPEPPILLNGLSEIPCPITVQPWDRENWTYLAQS